MGSLILVRSGSRALHGICRVPGDKSISHRGLLLGTIADGSSRFGGFLHGRDCLATVQVMRSLGVEVDFLSETELVVHGAGLYGLRESPDVLDCANSGTTMRLMMGLLAGQRFTSVLSGTEQLRQRPMARVVAPIRRLGATVLGRQDGALAPLTIRGGRLRGMDFYLPIASAQVKSAILLAGLYADGITTVVEPGSSRDHTERMLASMGAPIEARGRTSRIHRPSGPLRPLDMHIPGDPSSAAFLMVAAVCASDADVLIEKVCTNMTRHGLIASLREMGARIAFERLCDNGAEPMADIRLRNAKLNAVRLCGDRIVTMIDELPVFAVAATQAHGTTVIADAQELRVKETDRIETTIMELTKLGANLQARPDGMVIHGPTPLVGADVESHGDHRLAMALTVAGLLASGTTRVHGAHVTADSFPGFEATLASLGADITVE